MGQWDYNTFIIYDVKGQIIGNYETQSQGPYPSDFLVT